MRHGQTTVLLRLGMALMGGYSGVGGPVRMTQAELEAHPEWKGFGTEAGKHPPMRGWLSAPIVGRDGTNWGLLQLSDKYEGEFTEEDEKHFISFAELVSETLEALWNVRNLQKNALFRLTMRWCGRNRGCRWEFELSACERCSSCASPPRYPFSSPLLHSVQQALLQQLSKFFKKPPTHVVGGRAEHRKNLVDCVDFSLQAPK